MIELSPTATGVGAVVGAGVSVSAPCPGGTIAACAEPKGRNTPIAPTAAEVRKWRRPINRRGPDMVILLSRDLVGRRLRHAIIGRGECRYATERAARIGRAPRASSRSTQTCSA